MSQPPASKNYVPYTSAFGYQNKSTQYGQPMPWIKVKNDAKQKQFDDWKALPDSDSKYQQGVTLGFIKQADYDSYITTKTTFETWKARPDSDKKYRDGVNLGYINKEDYDSYITKKTSIDKWNAMPDGIDKAKEGLRLGYVSVSDYNAYTGKIEANLSAQKLAISQQNALINKYNSITDYKTRYQYGLDNGLLDKTQYDGLMMVAGFYEKFNKMENIADKLQFGVSTGILSQQEAEDYIKKESSRAKQIQTWKPADQPLETTTPAYYTVTWVDNGEKITQNFTTKEQAQSYMDMVNSRSQTNLNQLIADGTIQRVPTMDNSTGYIIKKENPTDVEILRLKEAGFNVEGLSVAPITATIKQNPQGKPAAGSLGEKIQNWTYGVSNAYDKVWTDIANTFRSASVKEFDKFLTTGEVFPLLLAGGLKISAGITDFNPYTFYVRPKQWAQIASIPVNILTDLIENPPNIDLSKIKLFYKDVSLSSPANAGKPIPNTGSAPRAITINDPLGLGLELIGGIAGGWLVGYSINAMGKLVKTAITPRQLAEMPSAFKGTIGREFVWDFKPEFNPDDINASGLSMSPEKFAKLRGIDPEDLLKQNINWGLKETQRYTGGIQYRGNWVYKNLNWRELWGIEPRGIYKTPFKIESLNLPNMDTPSNFSNWNPEMLYGKPTYMHSGLPFNELDEALSSYLTKTIAKMDTPTYQSLTAQLANNNQIQAFVASSGFDPITMVNIASLTNVFSDATSLEKAREDMLSLSASRIIPLESVLVNTKTNEIQINQTKNREDTIMVPLTATLNIQDMSQLNTQLNEQETAQLSQLLTEQIAAQLSQQITEMEEVAFVFEDIFPKEPDPFRPYEPEQLEPKKPKPPEPKLFIPNGDDEKELKKGNKDKKSKKPRHFSVDFYFTSDSNTVMVEAYSFHEALIKAWNKRGTNIIPRKLTVSVSME